MPEYINPNSHTVHLTGPDGKTIKVRARQKVTLSEYFDRYRARGFIKLLNETTHVPQNPTQIKPKRVQSQIQLTKAKQKRISRKATQVPQENVVDQKQRRQRKQEIQRARKISNATKVRRSAPVSSRGKKLVVGRRLAIDATELLRNNLEKNHFPVSNNVGVGIMSYNRVASLKRLINSIIRTTDLCRTTVFISDDASTNADMIEYLTQLAATPNFVIIRNKERGWNRSQ